MRNSDLEARVYAIIERIEKQQQIEDAWVELKAQWPTDIQKAARRIAGHANASRGQYILWVIGADEKQGVIGATKNELANWLPQIEAQFDGVAPTLTIDLVIPITGKGVSVVALLFEVTRPPYVIKSNNTGAIEREVPWREGTRIRSANRSELLRVLVEQQSVPELDVLSGSVVLTKDGNCYVHAELYVVSELNRSIVIPFHKCYVWFEIPGYNLRVDVNKQVSLAAPIKSNTPTDGSITIGIAGYHRSLGSLTIGTTDNEIIISGPGKITLRAQGTYVPTMRLTGTNIQLKALLRSAREDIDIELADTFTWVDPTPPDKELGRWHK